MGNPKKKQTTPCDAVGQGHSWPARTVARHQWPIRFSAKHCRHRFCDASAPPQKRKGTQQIKNTAPNTVPSPPAWYSGHGTSSTQTPAREIRSLKECFVDRFFDRLQNFGTNAMGSSKNCHTAIAAIAIAPMKPLGRVHSIKFQIVPSSGRPEKCVPMFVAQRYQ